MGHKLSTAERGASRYAGAKSVMAAVNLPAMSELWERIKAARLKSGLTQEAIGAACSPPVKKNSVAQWESVKPEGRTMPTLDNLATFSRMTRTSIDWLVTGAGDMDSGVFDANILTDVLALVDESTVGRNISAHAKARMVIFFYEETKQGRIPKKSTVANAVPLFLIKG